MSPREFIDLIRKAKPGERIVYHTGILIADRFFNKELNRTANTAYDEYEIGNCVLIQKRVDPVTCQYIAVRV